jgi:hypothetical protein
MTAGFSRAVPARTTFFHVWGGTAWWGMRSAARTPSQSPRPRPNPDIKVAPWTRPAIGAAETASRIASSTGEDRQLDRVSLEQLDHRRDVEASLASLARRQDGRDPDLGTVGEDPGDGAVEAGVDAEDRAEIVVVDHGHGSPGAGAGRVSDRDRRSIEASAKFGQPNIGER